MRQQYHDVRNRSLGQFRDALRFTQGEIRDLIIAWLALGIAFTLFLNRSLTAILLSDPGAVPVGVFLTTFFLSLLTVGIGFLLHELAHKVMAVWYGQAAEFKADYGMLGLAVASGVAGFLFAAPGAVYHQGYITERQNGIIAVAGPVTNLVLAVVFLPLVFLPGFIGTVGNFGVLVNLFLAAFNMIPFGPLDGRKVLSWSTPVFVLVFVPSVVLVIGWVIF